jgi:hypothetical protein
MVLKSGLEETGLLWCGLQLHNHRSFHAERISYRTLICQEAQVAPVPQPQRKECARTEAMPGRQGSPCALSDEAESRKNSVK